MKFCPKCDIRLKKNSGSSIISCPKCNYTEGQESEIQSKTSEESKSDFLVLEENEKTASVAIIININLFLNIIYLLYKNLTINKHPRIEKQQIALFT